MAVNVNDPCLFCEFLKNKEIAAENDLAFAIFDGFPVNPGHVLVIPKRHVANYFELAISDASLVALLCRNHASHSSPWVLHISFISRNKVNVHMKN